MHGTYFGILTNGFKLSCPIGHFESLLIRVYVMKVFAIANTMANILYLYLIPSNEILRTFCRVVSRIVSEFKKMGAKASYNSCSKISVIFSERN